MINSVRVIAWGLIHYDEATPHLHAFYIPVHDGKLNCKHYLGGDISEFQTEFYEKTGAKYGLDRGSDARMRANTRLWRILERLCWKRRRNGRHWASLGRAFGRRWRDWERSCGPLAMGAANEMENERLAQEKRNLEADRKKIEAQAKRNNDETLNLQRIRKL